MHNSEHKSTVLQYVAVQYGLTFNNMLYSLFLVVVLLLFFIFQNPIRHTAHEDKHTIYKMYHGIYIYMDMNARKHIVRICTYTF